MTSYKELGLVNTKDMFAKAIKVGMQFLPTISTTWSNYKQLFRLALRPSPPQ